jgi:hypothetical protein
MTSSTPDTDTPNPGSRTCAHCHGPIPPERRSTARYCGQKCHIAADNARRRERSGRPAPVPAETCARCTKPMPEGISPRARYCSKRCRNAASTARISAAARTT